MNSTGHMVLFQLAYNNMTPQAQRRVSQLLADPKNPEEGGYKTTAVDDNVPGAATYPDVFKSWARQNGKDGESCLHFYNQPIGDPRYTRGKQASTPNGIMWFQKQMAILQNPRSSHDKVADALRWVIHEYGDIGAQPGHCVNGYSKQFPKGDGGGNAVKLDWGSSGKWDSDLHALLDAGGAHPDSSDRSRTENNFKNLKEPLDRNSRQFIQSLAAQIGKQFPRTRFTTPQLQDQNPVDWVKSLGQQAQKIWPEFRTGEHVKPNDPRLADIQKTMDENVALAAYRLSDRLNQLYGSGSSTHPAPHHPHRVSARTAG
ncbi:MAG: S1/P1 nuclease [Candidatus Xenobia bacterium]